jgi:hypothetical protein
VCFPADSARNDAITVEEIQSFRKISINDCRILEKSGIKVVYVLLRHEVIKNKNNTIFYDRDTILNSLKTYKPDRVVTVCSCPKQISAVIAAIHLQRSGLNNVFSLDSGYEELLSSGLI